MEGDWGVVELVFVVVGEYDVVDFEGGEFFCVIYVLYVFDYDFVGLDIVDDVEVGEGDGGVYGGVE